ncbi:unnamed protein product [Schistosoma rodhaini]|uniref:Uncharacterized protein n=1 Tax=Schistosoma rodhaini TaxID=6188 RepID=A0AA85G2E8_9TREM|nr:unnamed protein product [Schistosoma rodhaini]
MNASQSARITECRYNQIKYDCSEEANLRELESILYIVCPHVTFGTISRYRSRFFTFACFDIVSALQSVEISAIF